MVEALLNGYVDLIFVRQWYKEFLITVYEQIYQKEPQEGPGKAYN